MTNTDSNWAAAMVILFLSFTPPCGLLPQHSRAEIVSIIDATCQLIQAQRVHRMEILATTAIAGVYQRTLERQGVEKIILSCAELPLILESEIALSPSRYIDVTEEVMKRFLASL